MCPDSTPPEDEFTPTTAAELSRFVADNASGNQYALFPAGGRTSLNYPTAPTGEGRIVSTSLLNETIDYPARDMTITVGSGMRIDHLNEKLKSEGQQLPVDVSQAHRATLGGVVATNTSGPRRLAYGTMRDYVIGISAVDARGRSFHSGGRVVKNVAGYDLCKLLVGSLGTLSIITEMTIKLKPIPATTSSLWVSSDSFEQLEAALETLQLSAATPVLLEVLNPAAAKQIVAESKLTLSSDRPVLVIGVEGNQNDVRWQIDVLRKELNSIEIQNMEVVQAKQAEQLLAALTEYQVSSDDPITFRANLLPSQTVEFSEQATRAGVAVQAHAGSGIVIGHMPDAAITPQQVTEILTPLRTFARKSRGNLVIVNCEDEWKQQLPVFGEQKPSWKLMQQIKTMFDPHNLLNPGLSIDAG